MRKVIPLLLASGWLAAGCTIIPDDFRDPYASTYDFGYHYGLHAYPQPYSYYQSCYGVYSPIGSCISYRPPYLPAPHDGRQDEDVIPLTQPPVMAVDDSFVVWRDTEPRSIYRRPAAATESMYWREDGRAMRAEPGRTVFPTQTRPTNRPVRAQRRASTSAAAPPRGSSSYGRSSPSRNTSAYKPSPRPAAPRSAPRPASAPPAPSPRPEP